MVLCVYGLEDYIKVFECFMKKYLVLNVEWVIRLLQNEKYLVLCDVVSWILEDIEWVFENLDLKGKIISRMKNIRKMNVI